MRASGKALQAFHNALDRGVLASEALAAFQEALLEELRDEVQRLPDTVMFPIGLGTVKRGDVLALLRPESELRYKPGDWLVWDERPYLVVWTDGDWLRAVAPATWPTKRDELVLRFGGPNPAASIRHATESEIAKARGEAVTERTK